MHYLNESHILLFLVQVLVLLGCARTLSVLCEELHIPAIAGEIFAGVLLGPTILGRYLPEVQHWLFPSDLIQATMLETVSWLGVFFLLLASGFHVDVAQALRSGKAAMYIGIVGVIVPIALGYPIFASLNVAYQGESATQLSFALFLSVAGSITAISVVARALGDMQITRKPMGGLALSACAINDIFGWFLFTVVMSLVSAHSVSTLEIVSTALSVIGFVVLSIALGAKIMHWALRRVKESSLPQAAAVQTLVVSAGLLCGAVTQWLGIHAILGFFLAGTMAGSAEGVSDEMRDSISDTLHAIFVPLFFATLGIHIDFFAGIELWPTLIFCAVSIGGKFVGAWLGAKMGGVSQRESILMGFIFIPGGAMEIVVATLALELKLISSAIFVAIVFSALISSVLAGPLIRYQAGKLGLFNEISPEVTSS